MPLPMFGNDQYGDCVGAEEFSAKAADGHLGTDSEAISAARQWGTLNGGDLATVLDEAAASPYVVGGQQVEDGGKQTVNYTDWPSLCSAIAEGQVKIAVAAQQLEDAGAGNGPVWFLLSARLDSGIDHCVGLSGFGTLADCCAALKAAIPSAADANTPCVVLETWGGYGIVSFAALLAIMGSTPTAGNSEAWLRTPTTIVVGPTPPAPTPTPVPVPPVPFCHRRARRAAIHLSHALAEFFGGDDESEGH